MRKLIVTEFYSLDDLMSDSEDKMDWVTTTFSQDMGKSMWAMSMRMPIHCSWVK